MPPHTIGFSLLSFPSFAFGNDRLPISMISVIAAESAR